MLRLTNFMWAIPTKGSGTLTIPRKTIEDCYKRIRELETDLLNTNNRLLQLQNSKKQGGSHEKWANLLKKPGWVQNLISQKIGFDIADDIPDEHEEDAEFVFEQALTLALKSGALDGLYTGWRWKGKLHGRGFFWSKDKKVLIEGRWRDGKQYGIGWKFEQLKAFDDCIMGYWKDGEYSNGMSYFKSKGEDPLKCFNVDLKSWIKLSLNNS